MIDSATRDRYEKIANLMIAEVPQNQIAAVVGLDESRISQIKLTPEFQEIYGALAAVELDRSRELNDGWNAIEQDAMAIVVTNLQHNKDPDFALKAAMVANKAVRRGGNGNRPIPTELGTRTVLNLSATFVQNIQQNGISSGKSVGEGFSIPSDLRKYNDVQNPTVVDQLLSIAESLEKPLKEDKRSDEQKQVASDIEGLFNS